MKKYILLFLLAGFVVFGSLGSALEIEVPEKGTVVNLEFPSVISGAAGNGSFNETLTDLLYLRLDTSNDPLTNNLTISNSGPVSLKLSTDGTSSDITFASSVVDHIKFLAAGGFGIFQTSDDGGSVWNTVALFTQTGWQFVVPATFNGALFDSLSFGKTNITGVGVISTDRLNVSLLCVNNGSDCIDDWSAVNVSGNPFNQSLNKEDPVVFSQINITNSSGFLSFHITPDGKIGIGQTTDLEDIFTLFGEMDIIHNATENDEHSLEIEVDTGTFGDVKGLLIDYRVGAITQGTDEEAILINIDPFDSVGGEISGLEIITLQGNATVNGLKVGVQVNPIKQLSGIFEDMDSALSNNIDVLASFISVGSNVEIFSNNHDSVRIGNAVKFEEIEFKLDQDAGGVGIRPEFFFSTGVGAWTQFVPTDGTDGMRDSGVILWLDSDIPAWATGLGGEFLIMINRTQQGLPTPPVEELVQVASATEYWWRKDGDLNVKNVSALLYDIIAKSTPPNAFVFDGKNATFNSTFINITDLKNVLDNPPGLLNKAVLTYNSTSHLWEARMPVVSASLLIVHDDKRNSSEISTASTKDGIYNVTSTVTRTRLKYTVCMTIRNPFGGGSTSGWKIEIINKTGDVKKTTYLSLGTTIGGFDMFADSTCLFAYEENGEVGQQMWTKVTETFGSVTMELHSMSLEGTSG